MFNGERWMYPRLTRINLKMRESSLIRLAKIYHSQVEKRFIGHGNVQNVDQISNNQMPTFLHNNHVTLTLVDREAGDVSVTS
jgi:hypothetical protein